MITKQSINNYIQRRITEAYKKEDQPVPTKFYSKWHDFKIDYPDISKFQKYFLGGTMFFINAIEYKTDKLVSITIENKLTQTLAYTDLNSLVDTMRMRELKFDNNNITLTFAI